MARLRTFLTLCTSHLTEEVSGLLDDMGEDVEDRGFVFGDWRDHVTRSGFAFGHWVRVRQPDPSDEEDNVAEWLEGLPTCLADCLRYAGQFGCAYVMFDRDEEPLGSLPTYEW